MNFSIHRRRLIQTLSTVAAASAVSPTTWAQPKWPSRTVKIVVPYPAGGSSDVIARILSQTLAEKLGQRVIVENKAGANGNIGSSLVAKSTDQHSFLLCDIGALAISGSVYKNLTYDPANDLQPVAMLAYSPHLLAVNPATKITRFSELVEASKKKPVNFATTSYASPPHLAALEIAKRTGMQWNYIVYKGGAQAIVDVIAGQADVILNGLLATKPHADSGNLKALAVSSADRWPTLTDVPTLTESGISGFQSGSWQGVMAAKDTPPEVVQRVSGLLREIVSLPELRNTLSKQGAQIQTMDSVAMQKFLETERTRWAKIAQEFSISA